MCSERSWVHLSTGQSSHHLSKRHLSKHAEDVLMLAKVCGAKVFLVSLFTHTHTNTHTHNHTRTHTHTRTQTQLEDGSTQRHLFMASRLWCHHTGVGGAKAVSESSASAAVNVNELRDHRAKQGAGNWSPSRQTEGSEKKRKTDEAEAPKRTRFTMALQEVRGGGGGGGGGAATEHRKSGVGDRSSERTKSLFVVSTAV